MNRHAYYFSLAKAIAINGDTSRHYLLGAVGIRNDGAIVSSCNSKTKKPTRTAHAEYKVSRKLDTGSTVYVIRVLKDGSISLAKPCLSCQKAMKSKGVKRVYFSISNTEFDFIELK